MKRRKIKKKKRKRNKENRKIYLKKARQKYAELT